MTPRNDKDSEMPTEIFSHELLECPTGVMQQYLSHFKKDTNKVVAGLAKATGVWQRYADEAARREEEQPELVWSAAYFLNAINCTLVSTRMLLSGYLVPSGNLARQAVESVALGVVLAFPVTGAYRELRKERRMEHNALTWLRKNANHCGANKQNIVALRKQAKWFDQYSHPSRLALATIWIPSCEEHPNGAWNVGALFVKEHLKQYGQEVDNRISMTELLANSIAGTTVALKL